MTGSYEESLPYLTLGNKGGFYGALWYLGISKQHLYDFEGAIEDLNNTRNAARKTLLGFLAPTASLPNASSECVP